MRNKKTEALDFEISFYEGLVRENPLFTDVFVPLGDAYTKRGLYRKGLEVDLKLAGLRPMDPVVHYNLACSYSLLKKQGLALRALEKSLKLGYRDLRFIMGDPDLENLRKDSRFSEMIERYIPR